MSPSEPLDTEALSLPSGEIVIVDYFGDGTIRVSSMGA